MKRHLPKQFKSMIIYLICAVMLLSVSFPILAEPVSEQNPEPVSTESDQDGQKSDETEGVQDGQKSDETENHQSESKNLKDSAQNSDAALNVSADDINAYFWGLNPDSSVNIEDTGDYNKNLINGKTQVNENEITNSIVLTSSSKSANDKYYDSTASTNVLSALGKGNHSTSAGMIYPGNMLTYNNNLATGMTRDESIRQNKRDTGHFRGLISGESFDIKDIDISAGNAGSKIQKKMYDNSVSVAPAGFEFRIMAASSPLQLARGLNLTTDAVSEAVNNNQWDKIRTGEKKVVVVYAQQIIETLEFVWKDSNYAALFKKDTNINVPENAMLITKVNYGRGYLLTVDLNMTGSPSETPVNLEDAVKKAFTSNPNWNDAQKNALKYAAVSVKQIGDGNIRWDRIKNKNPKKKIPPITSITDFISYLSRSPYEKTKGIMSQYDQLVPLSYEAVAMGGINRWVKLEIKADKYDYSVKKAAKINDLEMVMRAMGDINPFYFRTYGIDLNMFNEQNAFSEKEYTIFDSKYPLTTARFWHTESFNKQGTDGCGKPTTVQYKENVFRWKGDVEAYKNIYGITFLLDKGSYMSRGRAVIKTNDKAEADLGLVKALIKKDDKDNRIHNGYGLKFYSPLMKNDTGNELTAILRRCDLSYASFATDFDYHGGAYKNQNRFSIGLNQNTQTFDGIQAVGADRLNRICKAVARNKPGVGYDGPECVLSYIKSYEENGKNLDLVNNKGPKTDPEKATESDLIVNPIKQ